MLTDIAYAQERDNQDPLAHFRSRFSIPDPDLIYLDGNSLGRLPKATINQSTAFVEHQWGERLIRSWNEGWFTVPERIGAKIAKLIGAQEDEVIMADSTSVNLFKTAVAALRYQDQHQASRTGIITDNLNFPSDIYILQGIIDLLGNRHQLTVVPSEDGIHGPVEEVQAATDEQTSLVTLSHTAFKNGYTYDMAAVTAMAHEAGAMMLWDISHSVGAVPMDINGCNVELAIGCTYKYLNGGPGAPAFLYVRRDLQDKLFNPITGWMGQNNLFAFGLDYEPTQGLRRFISGTPQMASTLMVEPGVDLLLEAGMDNLRQKSVEQSEYLIALWETLLKPVGFTLNSPHDATYRGSHVSLGHPEAMRIDLALINDKQVLPDFRAPDSIRLGIAPIYTTFSEILTAVIRMKEVVEHRLYEQYPDTP